MWANQYRAFGADEDDWRSPSGEIAAQLRVNVAFSSIHKCLMHLRSPCPWQVGRVGKTSPSDAAMGTDASINVLKAVLFSDTVWGYFPCVQAGLLSDTDPPTTKRLLPAGSPYACDTRGYGGYYCWQAKKICYQLFRLCCFLWCKRTSGLCDRRPLEHPWILRAYFSHLLGVF